MDFSSYNKLPNIGSVLKNAREDMDLSQIKVMELTGINNKSLSGYENNVAEPDIRTLVVLSQLYDISLDQLLLDKLPKNQRTKNEKMMLKYYRMLSDEQQRDLLIQIKALALSKK